MLKSSALPKLLSSIKEDVGLILVITVDGKLLASNNNGQKIVGVAGKHVENEAISAVLANTFADFENTDGKDTDSETKDSVSTKRLVLEVEGGCFFVSRVCADFLVGCHVRRSSGISMEEATRQHSRISSTLRAALLKLDG